MEMSEEMTTHPLESKWVIYAHLPHDTDWSVDSYKKIKQIEYLEDIIKVYENIPDTMIKNCMLFLMKDEIKPVWEDECNRDGGCFSYKISNSLICDLWKTINYMLVGGCITDNELLYNKITGLSISPKKNFCILKIWLKDCEITDNKQINEIEHLDSDGVLFKKHVPES